MKRKTIFLFIVTCWILAGFAPTLSGQDSVPSDSNKAITDSSTAVANASPAVKPPMSDSAHAAYLENAALGRALFTGKTRLIQRGPSCISCHNIQGGNLPEGGLLAKDLTHVYGRLGEAGIGPILSSTPFPAMASAYKGKPISPEEVAQLTAFFQQVEETAVVGEPPREYNTLMIGGSIGIVVWLGLIFGIYQNRKKASVKQAIYQRQIH